MASNIIAENDMFIAIMFISNHKLDSEANYGELMIKIPKPTMHNTLILPIKRKLSYFSLPGIPTAMLQLVIKHMPSQLQKATQCGGV